MDFAKYTVVKIEGEYATLRNTESGEELFIAMALLPSVDMGDAFEYRDMEFIKVL